MSEFHSEEIERVRAQAGETGDRRLAAIAIALSHEKVQELIDRNLGESHTYSGSRVFYGDQQEELRVVFEFERTPDRFTVTTPRFAVDVELASGSVRRVLDHYVDPPIPEVGEPGRLQPNLDVTRFAVEAVIERSLSRETAKVAWSKISHWV